MTGRPQRDAQGPRPGTSPTPSTSASGWPRRLGDGEVVPVAREFAAAVTLPVTAGSFDRTDGVTGPDPRAYGDLLAGLRVDECAWWLGVIRGWSEFGMPNLAHDLLVHAGRLVADGMLPTDWAQLCELAALAQALPPGRSPTSTDEPDPPEHRTRLAEREQRKHKRQRLDELFDDWGMNPARTEPPSSLEETERVLLHGSPSPYVAKGDLWYGLGEHRITVEQFLSIVADNTLSSWLDEAEGRAELVWCGRSLLRLGDRTSAYACFYLASAFSDEEEALRGPDPARGVPADPVLATAWRYRGSLADEHAALDGDRHLHQPFVHGLRIGDWMAHRGLEGRFPPLLAMVTGRALRHHLPVVVRQLRTLAWHSGWFLPGLDVNIGPVVDAPVPVPTGPPSRLTSSPAAVPPALAPPGRIGSEPPPPAGVPVPIGLADSGGFATLRVGPGTRCRIIGPAAADTRMAAVAETLARQGWTVLWVREQPAPPPAGWHRIRPTPADREQTPWWLAEIERAASVRALLADCLRAHLPDCTDPAAGTIVDAVVSAIGRAHDVYTDNGLGPARQQAMRLVSERASVAFHHTRDFRRAALLMDRALAAITALRRAVALTVDQPGSSGDHTGRGGRVQIELPGPGLADACAVTLLVASLVETLSALDRPPPTQDGPTEPAPSWDDFELTVVPRPDETRLDELTALVRSAGEPGGPPDGPPGDARPGPESPWLRTGIVADAHPARPVCVLLSGVGAVGASQVRALFDRAVCAPHALIVATTSTEPRNIGRCTADTDLLVSGLTVPAYETLAVAAGVRLPPALTSGIGDHGALLVGAAGPRVRTTRCVLWPPAAEGHGR